jgi:hypothetical protein
MGNRFTTICAAQRPTSPAISSQPGATAPAPSLKIRHAANPHQRPTGPQPHAPDRPPYAPDPPPLAPNHCSISTARATKVRSRRSGAQLSWKTRRLSSGRGTAHAATTAGVYAVESRGCRPDALDPPRAARRPGRCAAQPKTPAREGGRPTAADYHTGFARRRHLAAARGAKRRESRRGALGFA